jgi:hypothetical protein
MAERGERHTSRSAGGRDSRPEMKKAADELAPRDDAATGGPAGVAAPGGGGGDPSTLRAAGFGPDGEPASTAERDAAEPRDEAEPGELHHRERVLERLQAQRSWTPPR